MYSESPLFASEKNIFLLFFSPITLTESTEDSFTKRNKMDSYSGSCINRIITAAEDYTPLKMELGLKNLYYY